MTTPGNASIFDLREITPEDLADAIARQTADPLEVNQVGTNALIKWYRVRSGDRFYQVRNFYDTFFFCECKHFSFKGTVCKHILSTISPTCAKCKTRSTTKHGAICGACEMSSAPYLKTGSINKPIQVGSIRI